MWFSQKRRIKYLIDFCIIINYARLINYMRLLFSFFISRIIRKVYFRGMPWALSVEPAGFCNLECPECPLGAGVLHRKGGFVSMELFKKILNESQPELAWLNLYFQGEPFLNKSLPDLISEAKKYKIYTSISTNGHFLNEENCRKIINSKLDELIISLDGISSETYLKYRKGGDLGKVMNGITRLIEEKNKLRSPYPLITVQFIVFIHNEHEIPELINWCKVAKIDRLSLKSAQINDFGDGSIEPSSIEKYSRYKADNNGKYIMKGHLRNHCFRQWSSAVFSWDGQMTTCCYDKDLQFSPGNIDDASLRDLWNGGKLQHFRKQIISDKSVFEMCRNCPEGVKN